MYNSESIEASVSNPYASCWRKICLPGKCLGDTISARNKDQKLIGHFLKIGYFIGYIDCCPSPIENVCKIWPTKMEFGQSNAEIGWKMANG